MEKDYREDLVYTLALTQVKGIKSADIKKLMEGFPESKAIFEASSNALIKCLEPRRYVAALSEAILRADNFDWAKGEIERSEKLGVSIISFRDEKYPGGLKFIPDPPPVLYMKGNIVPLDAVAIAIVGTRRASNYGRTAAVRITKELARYNITIVSGLARGIDSIAHRETLLAGGRTIAVMATGADITYPPENRKLREQIEENGATVTEFPIGTQPLPWRFPVRNRIISGLSLGCLVVEAPQRSGALITARVSMEYNRDVFAVPGNITSYRSKGCNMLIKDGAKPVTCAEDILEEMDVEFEKKNPSKLNFSILNEDEKKIFCAIDEEGSIEELIIQKFDTMPSFKVTAGLMQLQLKGFTKRLPGNVYVRMGECQ
ncbi:MAG: DNA-processing protein DprA [Candidatus Eremiobacteraeota bacterium]|nr:DNA-processing protein DprA [Candidatus Eremiobacteraeota bacterium]